jgi:hypothetical protein
MRILERITSNETNHIVMDHCKIPLHDWRTLAIALAANTSITSLSCCACDMDDECARIVATALTTRIEIVNLRHNRIGNEGAQALANVFSLSSIREIHLDFNCIGDVGLNALRLALEKNSNITRIAIIPADFRTENATPSMYESIWKQAQRNHYISLARMLLIVSRPDSPLMRLPAWLYEEIIRRVVMIDGRYLCRQSSYSIYKSAMPIVDKHLEAMTHKRARLQ